MNYYVIFAGIGSVFALFVYYFAVKREGYPLKLSVFAYISPVIGLFAGARLFGHISAKIHYMNTGEQIVPGIVFYGGLFGFIIMFLILQRAMLGDFSKGLCDAAGISIPLFHAFGRIGCFLTGCCGGFMGAVPVQLLESLGNFIIFAVLLVLYIKQKATGRLLWIYLLSYAVMRFFIEFFREDVQRGMIGALSFSQVCSIMLAVFLAGLYYGRKVR